MYILLNDDKIVLEIIPEEDINLPGVSISQRYPQDFIQQLIQVDDSINVEENWKYDSESGKFFEPEAVIIPFDFTPYQEYKINQISEACHEAIINGVDVTLSDGTTGHFSLEETDQINLTTAYNSVLQGATGYPYHADGELCKIYSAQDIITIYNAYISHKTYHTTYCNHLMAWVKRTETIEELDTIVYGIELPEDLATNMNEIIANMKN